MVNDERFMVPYTYLVVAMDTVLVNISGTDIHRLALVSIDCPKTKVEMESSPSSISGPSTSTGQYVWIGCVYHQVLHISP